jgi:hypothetical protein
MNASPVVEPTMMRFFQILPGLLLFQPILSPRSRSARRSTVPSMPKVGIDCPVRASMACRKLLIQNSSRLSFPFSLCQKLMPRLGSAFSPSWIQISFPVAASSAISDPFRPDTYTASSTTTGLKPPAA